MKRFLVFFLCVVFMMTSFASFAEGEQSVDGTTTATLDSTVVSAQDEVKEPVIQEETTEVSDVTTAVYETDANVSQEEVDKLAEIDGISEIEAEQQSVAESIYSTDKIDTTNISAMLENIQKYLTIRDKYYSLVLLKLKVISETENKALAKKAIVKFEQNFVKHTAIDRMVNNKIEKIIKYLKANSNKLDTTQKASLKVQLKTVMQRYFRERELIIKIHNSIRKLKIGLYKDQIVKLKQYAQQLEKGKKFKEALAIYESAMTNSDGDKELLKKIGELNKKLNKKAAGIFVGGKKVNPPVDPVVKDGTTLVPLRAMAEALGAEVKYDAKTKTITITKDGKEVQLTLNSKEIKVNGEKMAISAAANTISGSTMVPLRAVSEALDANVGYDAQNQIITVDDSFAQEEGTIDAEEIVGTEMVTGEDIGKPDLDKKIKDKKDAKVKLEKEKLENKSLKNKSLKKQKR